MQGLQNILAGDQCMTVYKAIKKEADAAAELAIAPGQGREGRHRPDGQGPRVAAGTCPSVLLDAAWPSTKDERQGRRRRRLRDQGRAVHRRLRARCAPRPASASPDLRSHRTGADRRRAARTARRRTASGEPEHRRRSTTVTATPLLELRGINKSFGPVQVLHDVDFTVYAGEVTALVGDNGAGKSTLVKCIGGIYPIDSGEYRFEGEPVAVHSPRDAAAARHRDRLPGPRAVRQPRHRPEHVPRPGEAPAGLVLDEPTMEQTGRRDPGRPVRAHRASRSASRSPASPAASARPSRSPRPCCGTARWSSSTSRPPRSASRRPRRCSNWSAGSPTTAWPSCSSRTT